MKKLIQNVLRISFRFMLIEKLKGRLDYYLYPQWRDSWGGPFNGQQGRERIFEEIVTKLPVHTIVETGTFRGSTTERFVETGLPVFTIECQARNYGFASARLGPYCNVHLLFGDSRKRLRELLENRISSLRDVVVFFYLDAHWNADLPLAEELEIIFENCPRAVVMIDDFAVPDDPDYKFDDYGPDKALDKNYIGAAMNKHGLITLYPSLSGAMENGMKRGCVVLTKQIAYNKVILSLEMLRQL